MLLDLNANSAKTREYSQAKEVLNQKIKKLSISTDLKL